MFETCSKSPNLPTLPSRQRGAVLFIALIMLLLLTLIGITTMQVTLLQERMAGGFRVQHQAFEFDRRHAQDGAQQSQPRCGQQRSALLLRRRRRSWRQCIAVADLAGQRAHCAATTDQCARGCRHAAGADWNA